MEQLNNYADSRLIRGCIFCGGSADTRDHIPSKCILDKPYPENLPIVGCCYECNQSFSSDEQYFVCFLECLLCGSTKPENIRRPSISKIFSKSPGLRKRIENSTTEVDGKIAFTPEFERIDNVMLKLAQGHAAFELSLMLRDKPNQFWYGLLSSLSEEEKNLFNSVHFQHNVGEVGSRLLQRLLVVQLSIQDGDNIPFIINDWVDVQNDRYRYIAIDDMGKKIIRIVIDEFFACEVVWESN
jgi:hypothetical protein